MHILQQKLFSDIQMPCPNLSFLWKRKKKSNNKKTIVTSVLESKALVQ
jgi:hypothetical protein